MLISTKQQRYKDVNVTQVLANWIYALPGTMFKLVVLSNYTEIFKFQLAGIILS